MSNSAKGVSLAISFGDPLVVRHLAALAVLDRRNFNAARREIGEFFKADIQDCFDKQALFDGSAMPPSKAAQGRTKYWGRNNKKLGRVKGSVRKAGKTLINHGHLYGSYTFNLTSGGLEFGSDLVYAAIHHFGGETGSKKGRFNMTARPVMGVSEKHKRAIGDYFIAALRGAAQGGAA